MLYSKLMGITTKNMVLRSAWLHLVLLALLTAGVYANSLGGDFVYDDKVMIVKYDLIKDIENFPRAFISATSLYGNVNYYRPIQTVSYMIDYYLWGDWPPGFHLTNIFSHIVCVLLVYFFIGMLFKNKSLSFITAVLFAVHPVHTSVVSYIAGRADAMLCIFMLLCFIFYTRYRFYLKGKSRYAFSLLFFALSLATKEFAMMIPLVIVLFDRYAWRWTSLNRQERARPGYLPFFIILTIYIFFRINWMSFFVEGAMPPFPLKDRLITVPYLIVQYMRLILLPNDLHIGREPWVAQSILNAKVAFSAVFLIMISYVVYRGRKNAPAIYFGMWWFLLMIIPSLNITAASYYTFAENWLYIPSIGLFLVVAAIAEKVYVKLSLSSLPKAKYVVLAFIGLYASAMGAVT
ncbi:MAG: hypothetical protein WBD17_05990, partial [Candidatus Omnitrophota bacterium]